MKLFHQIKNAFVYVYRCFSSLLDALSLQMHETAGILKLILKSNSVNLLVYSDF